MVKVMVKVMVKAKIVKVKLVQQYVASRKVL